MSWPDNECGPEPEERDRLYRDRTGRCEKDQADICEKCPGNTLAAQLAPMQVIGELLRTQDNRITAHPVFIVQQRRRVWGLAEGYAETFAWITTDDDEGGKEVREDLSLALEAAHLARVPEPEGYRRIGYVDIWEFVTACFTEAGAEEYIRVNGHNLKEPRVYVTSAYRNEEWIALRAFLLSLAEGSDV